MSLRRAQLAIIAETLSTDARQAAAMARADGFAGVSFDTITSQVDVTQLSLTGKREFRRLLASNDVQLAALRADAGKQGFGPGTDVDRLLAQARQIMEAAKGLSATPLVCLELGPLPEPVSAPPLHKPVTQEHAGLIIIPTLEAPAAAPEPPRPDPDAAVIAHVDGALRELGAIADRIGVTLALRSELSSYAALERALAAAACPWFGVDLDPAAMLRDCWSADGILSRLAPLIRHVRARDAIIGSDHRTKPAAIGRGSVEWAKLLSDLDAAGFNGWLTIDPLELPDRRAAAAAAVEHFKAFLP